MGIPGVRGLGGDTGRQGPSGRRGAPGPRGLPGNEGPTGVEGKAGLYVGPVVEDILFVPLIYWTESDGHRKYAEIIIAEFVTNTV